MILSASHELSGHASSQFRLRDSRVRIDAYLEHTTIGRMLPDPHKATKVSHGDVGSRGQSVWGKISGLNGSFQPLLKGNLYIQNRNSLLVKKELYIVQMKSP